MHFEHILLKVNKNILIKKLHLINMNTVESVAHIEEEIELEPEIKEKTITAQLIFTKEQPIGLIVLMESIEAGEFSENDILSLEKTTEVRKIKPKFTFTKDQKRDLRDAFNLLDHTGEGKIKADDFRVVIKALGYEPTKEELQHMIDGVDKTQSGKLSFENFETAIMRKIMSLDSDGDIMKSFRLFDNDDAGAINFDNVKRVSELLGANLTDEEIEEMIDDADKDFDGAISVSEFMRMIKTSVNIETP